MGDGGIRLGDRRLGCQLKAGGMCQREKKQGPKELEKDIEPKSRRRRPEEW